MQVYKQDRQLIPWLPGDVSGVRECLIVESSTRYDNGEWVHNCLQWTNARGYQRFRVWEEAVAAGMWERAGDGWDDWMPTAQQAATPDGRLEDVARQVMGDIFDYSSNTTPEEAKMALRRIGDELAVLGLGHWTEAGEWCDGKPEDYVGTPLDERRWLEPPTEKPE